MDTGDVRNALAPFPDFAGLGEADVVPILGGWASWTFELRGEWIVRFPRNDAVARAAHRELRLLDALAGRLPVATPAPVHVGEWRGYPFFTYRRIPGRAMTASDGTPAFLAALRDALAALHAFPVEEAAGLLGVPPTRETWRQWYVDVWAAEFEPYVLPQLGPALAAAVTEEFWRVVGDPPRFPPSLTHSDLNPEHVLVDDTAGGPRPVGIIDFEDASIGDPVVDFVSAVRMFGPAAFDALARGRDLGDAPRDRVAFYTWSSALYHVVYGVKEDVPRELEAGLASLRAHFAVR